MLLPYPLDLALQCGKKANPSAWIKFWRRGWSSRETNLASEADGGQVGAAKKMDGILAHTAVCVISAECPPTLQDIKGELYVDSVTLEAKKKKKKEKSQAFSW